MASLENEIYSERSQRITVDTDWADGLISRYVSFIHTNLHAYTHQTMYVLFSNQKTLFANFESHRLLNNNHNNLFGIYSTTITTSNVY